MITKETCERIWHCYREIAAGKKLLADIAEEMKNAPAGEPYAPKLEDAFGRPRDLQLGIPSGDNGHRLFRVPYRLAESVIRAHVAAKEAELVEANEQARIELGDNQCQPTS